MAPSNLKTELSISDFEVETEDIQQQARARLYRAVDSLRVGMTAIALVAGIVILGLSADTLAVYQRTHVPASFLLPLWPQHFDIRPTNALLAGSVLVSVANATCLITSRIQSLRRRAGVHTSVSLAAPFVAFVSSIVAMSVFYAVNSSNTVDTLQSWTCSWKRVNMLSQPHFGTLCKESQAGLALSIILVPVEFIVLAVTGYQVVLERKINQSPGRRQIEKGHQAPNMA